MTEEVTEAPQWRPFHETIVDILLRDDLDLPQLEVLAVVIKGTLIPTDHEVIAQRWARQMQRFGGALDYGVTFNLVEQARRADREARKAKERPERDEGSMTARVGRYLLTAELAPAEVDLLWNALPGEARVALETEVLAEVVARHERARATQ